MLLDIYRNNYNATELFIFLSKFNSNNQSKSTSSIEQKSLEYGCLCYVSVTLRQIAILGSNPPSRCRCIPYASTPPTNEIYQPPGSDNI